MILRSGLSLWLGLACLPALVSAGAQATLVADAHVSSARPSVNAGTLTNLNVGGGNTTLLQFDLSLLPAGTTAAQVTRAVLRIYCNRADTPGTMNILPVAAAWDEYSVTYATVPTFGTSTQTVQVSAAEQFVSLDVTSTVQAWITGTTANYGLALTSATAVLQFDSKENDQTGHAPDLQIVLAAGGAGSQGAAGTQGAVGPQGAAGPQGPAGSQGAVGSQGFVGAQGPAGVRGFTGLQGAAGAAGNVGPQGPTGSNGMQGSPGVGAQGLTGVAGLPGVAGAAGAVGPPGLPGMVYRGVYASTTSYALGDVVLFAGASYTSLVGANVGQTPGFSPAFWGVLTAQGSQGIQGATGSAGAAGPQGLPGSFGPPGERGDQGQQGAAGQAGAQGLSGPVGADGLSGPTGPAGVAGPAGMAFRGAYDSSANYALADSVQFNGAGYISLIAANHGNTPSLSPVEWSLFATGTPGAAGAAGSTGPSGIMGPPGSAGLAGPNGPAGPAGAQGPPVANYLGTYSSVTNYAATDAVSYSGSTYVSLLGSNHGNPPDTSPTYWAVLAAQGPAGTVGATGLQGPAGAAGNPGTPGPAGPQGAPIAFAGGWLASQNYSIGDAVSYLGGSYIAIVANVGRRPDVSPVYWGVLAASGAAGPTGSQGATGLQGSSGSTGAAGAPGGQGPAGPQGLAGGTGTTGPSGPTGPAGTSGINGAAGATGPQGLAGVPGAAGSPGINGALGMNFRSAWSQFTNYAVRDAVNFNGSAYIAESANTNLQPDAYPQAWTILAQAGGAGPTGAAGSSATISIGTVTTLAAGAQATVTDTGTPASPILNFGIPQGVAGASSGSPGGNPGIAGGSFAAIFHSVSFSTAFYAVNAPVAMFGEAASVLAWVPRGCSAVRLDVFSLQSNTVTVRLRNGPAAAMADTTLSCAATSGGSCSSVGAVAIAPGSLIDFSISGASGTPAAVWTQLECD